MAPVTRQRGVTIKLYREFGSVRLYGNLGGVPDLDLVLDRLLKLKRFFYRTERDSGGKVVWLMVRRTTFGILCLLKNGDYGYIPCRDTTFEEARGFVIDLARDKLSGCYRRMK